jgi:hypothetical protein
MKKQIIVGGGLAIVILAIVVVILTFTQMPGTSDLWGGDVSPPLTETISSPLDETGSGPQPSRSIETVKAAWEEQLMARPGVMGVGIGLTEDGQEKCIKVYVNSKASALAAQIPNDIEGYPVEIEIRKTFRFW